MKEPEGNDGRTNKQKKKKKTKKKMQSRYSKLIIDVSPKQFIYAFDADLLFLFLLKMKFYFFFITFYYAKCQPTLIVSKH